MRFVFKILVAIILAVCSSASHAQDCSSDKPSFENCRMVGKIKVYSSENPTSTSAGIRLYLLGKAGDIVPDKNATIRVLNDVLIMRLGYYAPRNIIPMSVHFWITSFSTKPSKYEANHKLSIFLDDKLLLSENMEMGNSIVVNETLRLEMKYTDFLKFTAAKKITIQFGETKIELKPEEVEVLNDLNKTIKYLNNPPVFDPILFRSR